MNQNQIVNRALTHRTKHTVLTGKYLPMVNEIDGELGLLIKNKRTRFSVEVKRESREYHLTQATGNEQQIQGPHGHCRAYISNIKSKT